MRFKAAEILAFWQMFKTFLDNFTIDIIEEVEH